VQIFVPNRNGCSLDHLREVGLEELLRDGDSSPMAVDIIGVGPGGHRGVVFYWPRSCSKPGYHPESQKWIAAKTDAARNLPAGRFHLCLDGDGTPETLLRDEDARLAGYFVELDAGRKWAIPNSKMLPFRFALDDEGNLIKVPKRQYEPLHKRMQWAFEIAESNLRDGTDIPWDDAIAYAAEMLSINYRVNREICFALELLDNRVGQILKMSVDFEKLHAIVEAKGGE
jgi:hypothetical protein